MRSLAVELASAAALCALAGCTLQTVDGSRAACASYGFQAGSDAFAECVQKEQLVHTIVLVPTDAPAVAAPQLDPNPLGIGTSGSGGSSAWSAVGPGGQPVISSSDCIGAVVNGVCHGTPAPGAPTATCYGQMVGGVCTGPMF